MKAGKVSEKILKRSVTEPIKATACGGDGGNIRMAEATVLADGPLSVYIGVNKAVNDTLIKGAVPQYASVNILIYENTDERTLKDLMTCAGQVCSGFDLSVLCGQTHVIEGEGIPIMTITCSGTVSADVFIGKTEPAGGMHIVMTKAIGIEGTAIILDKFYGQLAERFSAGFLEKCNRFKYNISTCREVQILKEALVGSEDIDVAECINVSDGGVFSALWRLSDMTSHGVEVYLQDIPVWQETVEFTELYNINPYQMASAGSVLIVTGNGERLVEKFAEYGVDAAVIGRLTDNNDKAVISGDEKRYLESSAEDEIYRIYKR